MNTQTPPRNMKELDEVMERTGEIDPMRCFPDWYSYSKFLQGLYVVDGLPLEVTREYKEMTEKEIAEKYPDLK